MKITTLGLAEIENVRNPYDQMILIIKSQLEYLALAKEGQVTKDGKAWEPVNSNKQVEIDERIKLLNYLESVKNNYLAAKQSK